MDERRWWAALATLLFAIVVWTLIGATIIIVAISGGDINGCNP